MTIAQAFNEIAVAQGGTASKSGSITGAIDALNDALAGSDQAPAQTIEDAVRLLGQNIGGGGGAGLVVVTADTDGYPSMSAEEIFEAAEAGNVVVYKIMQGDDSFELLHLENCTYGEQNAALFTNVIASPDGIRVETVFIQTKTDEVAIFTYPSGD